MTERRTVYVAGKIRYKKDRRPYWKAYHLHHRKIRLAQMKARRAMTDKLTLSELSQFTGTENWYRHNLAPGITYTDGVRYMASKADAYWLIDEIAIPQGFVPKLKEQPFQVWKLRLNKKGHGAKLIVEDGNGNVVLCKRIEFTDFPLPEIDVWFTGNVILLPSEY